MNDSPMKANNLNSSYFLKKYLIILTKNCRKKDLTQINIKIYIGHCFQNGKTIF